MGASMKISQKQKLRLTAANHKIHKEDVGQNEQKHYRYEIESSKPRLKTQNENRVNHAIKNIKNKNVPFQNSSMSDLSNQLANPQKQSGVVLNDSELSSKLSLFSVVQQYVISKDSQSHNFEPLKQQFSEDIFNFSEYNYQNAENQQNHINCSASEKQQQDEIHPRLRSQLKRKAMNEEKSLSIKKKEKNKNLEDSLNHTPSYPTVKKDSGVSNENNEERDKLQNGTKEHDKGQQFSQNYLSQEVPNEKKKKTQNKNNNFNQQIPQKQYTTPKKQNLNEIKVNSKQPTQYIFNNKIVEVKGQKKQPSCESLRNYANIDNIQLKKKPSSMPAALSAQSPPPCSSRTKPQLFAVSLNLHIKNSLKQWGTITREEINALPQFFENPQSHLINKISSTQSQPNLLHNDCEGKNLKNQPITQHNYSDSKNDNNSILCSRPRKLLYF